MGLMSIHPRNTQRVLQCGLGPLLLAVALGGCVAGLVFDPTPLPEERILRDLAYMDGPGAHAEKHRFDLFLPDANAGWPTLIFVHGGGWDEGDKSLEAAGFEVYANIGRFYASQGFGVAVINYRLQPEVTWRDQVLDVTHALAAVRREVEKHGGDPDVIFLSGHSAGGQLASYVAVADWPRERVDGAGRVCGVVTVSGAGYDLADDATYDNYKAKRKYYAQRFRIEGDGDDWAHDASMVNHLDAGDPPFLVVYAEREYPSLRHQARLLHGELKALEVPSRLHVVPKQRHRLVVVTFSQPGEPVTEETVRFLREFAEDCEGQS